MVKVIIREQLDVRFTMQHLALGVDPRVVHCAEARDGSGKIDIWVEAELETLNRSEPSQVKGFTSFYVVATGESTAENLQYLKTVVMSDGHVWHVHSVT